MIQANTNGRLHDAAEPSLSPLNRGFLYGDCVYEVWRTYAGVVFGWEAHFRRLLASASALGIPLPLDEGGLFSEIRKTAAEFRQRADFAGDLYIRLQIYRGMGPIGLDPALADASGFVILVQPCPLLGADQLEKGLRLSLSRRLRRNPAWALNPAWKTGNYLNNLLCLQEARQRGADEVVMLNESGEVTEAAVMNIAFIRGREVVTPPLEAGILAGITRGVLTGNLQRGADWEVRELPIREEDLGSFDECFLTSTTKDIVPVAAIDGHRYRTGSGTLSLRLKAAFAREVQRECAEHPERQV